MDEHRWCFAWPGNRGASAKPLERAALVRALMWEPGEVISISFLDGDPAVQARVREVALRWIAPGMANLVLDFREDTTVTDVRISFLHRGSWSLLGKACRTRSDVTVPTMNYGWLRGESTDDELRRVVLHEFGHALGLIHEHQNPAGGIPWNRQAVIDDLSGPPNEWDAATIERNMFATYDTAETNFTATDPASIMMYPIPSHWTDGQLVVELNSELSPTDRAFIQQQYP